MRGVQGPRARGARRRGPAPAPPRPAPGPRGHVVASRPRSCPRRARALPPPRPLALLFSPTAAVNAVVARGRASRKVRVTSAALRPGGLPSPGPTRGGPRRGRREAGPARQRLHLLGPAPPLVPPAPRPRPRPGKKPYARSPACAEPPPTRSPAGGRRASEGPAPRSRPAPPAPAPCAPQPPCTRPPAPEPPRAPCAPPPAAALRLPPGPGELSWVRAEPRVAPAGAVGAAGGALRVRGLLAQPQSCGSRGVSAPSPRTVCPGPAEPTPSLCAPRVPPPEMLLCPRSPTAAAPRGPQGQRSPPPGLWVPRPQGGWIRCPGPRCAAAPGVGPVNSAGSALARGFSAAESEVTLAAGVLSLAAARALQSCWGARGRLRAGREPRPGRWGGPPSALEPAQLPPRNQGGRAAVPGLPAPQRRWQRPPVGEASSRAPGLRAGVRVGEQRGREAPGREWDGESGWPCCVLMRGLMHPPSAALHLPPPPAPAPSPLHLPSPCTCPSPHRPPPCTCPPPAPSPLHLLPPRPSLWGCSWPSWGPWLVAGREEARAPRQLPALARPPGGCRVGWHLGEAAKDSGPSGSRAQPGVGGRAGRPCDIRVQGVLVAVRPPCGPARSRGQTLVTEGLNLLFEL
ncbi:basic proline-rich protein-like [Canis lupus dingo]|uniref:basic proline-rich protein-like n=1 Tax=Canis lupus dingo TaxID=286419 RepID=UPI0020C3ABF9|nr:basic proline-rich protein-like [Canis lupus dingo]